MKFREHRGGLWDSMQTVVEIKDHAELVAHITKLLFPYYAENDIAARIAVEPYGGFDERIGWNTYIVTIKDYGVMGFTDGPV